MKKQIIAYIFTFLYFFTASAQSSYNSLIYEGNKLFDEKKYEVASSKFLQAIEKQKDFAAHYNLANTFYKRKLYDEAVAEYQEAGKLAQNNADKVASLYNCGNAMVQKQDYNKALQVYQKALKLSPSDENIRRNIQIVKKKMQDQNNSHSSKTKPTSKNTPKDKSPAESPQNSEGKNQEEGNIGNAMGKGADKNEKNEPESKNKTKMSEELKKSIFNRVEGREQETARRILNKNSYYMPRSNDKDW